MTRGLDHDNRCPPFFGMDLLSLLTSFDTCIYVGLCDSMLLSLLVALFLVFVGASTF